MVMCDSLFVDEIFKSFSAFLVLDSDLFPDVS
jgi:hypothetical protein